MEVLAARRSPVFMSELQTAGGAGSDPVMCAGPMPGYLASHLDNRWPPCRGQSATPALRELEWTPENHGDTEEDEESSSMSSLRMNQVTSAPACSIPRHEDTTTSAPSVQKQSQIAVTLNWLTENYERAEGVCLPRCVLYTHYLDFCKKLAFSPAGAATFGKIIRQRFPKLTTRRLGTRGQSKYHYYGIGIKETSIYYHSVYAGKGLTRFSGTKIKTEGSSRKYTLSSKAGTLLPEFPDAKNLILPSDVDPEKLQTFIMMYRTHCQRILDTVISANFDEVQNFLVHFWQGMPDHLLSLLSADVITDIVGLCDSILYKVLIDVLIPSTIQDLPESLSAEIKMFVKYLPLWLDTSMEDVPDALKRKKLEVAKEFIQSARRQIAFVHLAQTARTVLTSNDSISQMVSDLNNIELDRICAQAGFADPKRGESYWKYIKTYFEELKSLLTKQAPIEGYTEWLDNVIDACVLQVSSDRGCSFRKKASSFLLQWSIVGSLIMRDFTLLSAASFGSFHLIRMMFDEYVFLVLETQHACANEQQRQASIQKLMKHRGEIVMKASLRNPTTRNNSNSNSPKGRKRKSVGEISDSNDDDSCEANGMKNSKQNNDKSSFYNSPTPQIGGATRQPPFIYMEELQRSATNQNGTPHSPITHSFTSFHGNTFDRGSYLSHVNLNNYSDYVSASHNTYPSSRIPSLTDNHGSSYGSTPYSNTNIGLGCGGGGSGYWNESRTHGPLDDCYPPYAGGYGKYTGTYESYGRASAFVRTNVYQDPTYAVTAFDHGRTLYRSHDNYTAAPLTVSAYNGNYIDMTSPGSYYGRQDGLYHQNHDVYTTNVHSSIHSINKSFVPAFR